MITQFALRLICGMGLAWCVLPRAEITSGFFRIQCLVTLGLAVLAAVASGDLPDAPLGEASLLGSTGAMIASAALAALSFLGSMLWTLERRAGATRVAFLVAAVAATAVVLGCVSTGTARHSGGWLYAASELSTAIVSGAAVCGMLLGHWYLTAPSMSTAPLNRANHWFGLAAGTRLVLGITGVTLYCPLLSSSQDMQSVWSGTHTVWLSLQWLGGIVGPLVIYAMVLRILRYRNTQAATGVLFVGVILAFLGEMTGALLRSETGFPL